MEITYDKISTNQLQIIYKLTKSLSNIGDAENILEKVLLELMHETGAEVGAFVYFDSVKDQFSPKMIKSITNDKPDSVSFSKTIFRDVVESKGAVLSFDVQSEENYKQTESIILSDIRAVLAFPLIVEERIYGIMYFDSRENRQGFNESARQLLSFFTPIASITLEQILQKSKYEKENILLRNQIEQSVKIPTMIGESPPMNKLFHIISKVATKDVSVVVTGENGTGKDLVARAIHDFSTRKEKPFVAQYVGNIPSTILESELFGYKKGAFTGAHQDKKGLFEAVNTGTLFLDEIGDLPMELQTKFLRVLQNHEIKRLGENIIRNVDVRIVAATNKDLNEMVKNGEFREDLFYRLNVINIKVPALRDRKSDIPLLVNHFIKKENEDVDIQVNNSALRKLMDYHWPGNVRQLENIIKRASIFASNNTIQSDDIIFDDMDEPIGGTLEDFSNRLIISRLKEFNDNKTRAAKSLGISLRSLQMKTKNLGI